MRHVLFTGLFFLLTITVRAQEFKVLLEEKNVENAYPRLSKDGKRILYQSNRSGKWQVYILDIASGKSRQITQGQHNNNFPDWSADNRQIAFVSDRDGNEEIYLVSTDGKQPQRLTNDPERDIHPYFSPDGKYLLFNSTRDKKSLDIYRLRLSDKKVERLTNTLSDETCARYSGDMKSIVFLRNDDMSDDVYLMDTRTALTDNLTKTAVIRDGWPMYSPDGQWIYYASIEKGPYSIFRIRKDGTGKQQLTFAKPGEEDARPFISSDGKALIYNKRSGKQITINLMRVENSK